MQYFDLAIQNLQMAVYQKEGGFPKDAVGSHIYIFIYVKDRPSFIQSSVRTTNCSFSGVNTERITVRYTAVHLQMDTFLFAWVFSHKGYFPYSME